MPLYEYECQKGHKFNRFLKLAEYNDPQTCECGCNAKRLISAPMIAPMFEDYQSPIDGSPITSKKKRNEDLARNGCVPYEEGMRQEADRKVKNDELKLEKEVDRTMDATIESFTPRQRELLDQEMKGGADLSYDRSSTNE